MEEGDKTDQLVQNKRRKQQRKSYEVGPVVWVGGGRGR